MLPPDWAEHGRYGTHRMLVQAFGGGYASYRPWGNEEHTSNMAQLGAGNAGIRDYVWEKGNKIANIARMVYDDYTAADSPSKKAVDTPHKKVIRVMQVQNWNYGFESCNYSEAGSPKCVTNASPSEPLAEGLRGLRRFPDLHRARSIMAAWLYISTHTLQ